jgi:ribosomal protein L22
MAETKEQKPEVKETKTENKTEKKEETKTEKKTDKKAKQNIIKKTEAVVNGRDLPVSTKHCMAICRAIKGKSIEEAIAFLEKVAKLKLAVRMKGELPHRHGMERGRYPKNAALQFIKLLHSLSANAAVNNVELEKAKLECHADRASPPRKRSGMRGKRSHITIKIKEVKQDKKKNK